MFRGYKGVSDTTSVIMEITTIKSKLYFSYKMNKIWPSKLEHGDYSY